jgi:hypothetical protein
MTTFYFCQTVAGLLIGGALSDERTGLLFTIPPGHRQRSHSWFRVPRGSWPYFTVSDSRLPQPGGPGPCIYISQEQCDPVISPGTGFPFRRLLWLAGLQWKYSNPPPRVQRDFSWVPRFQDDWTRNSKKTSWWFEVRVSELRSFARRRLVESENPSACATVSYKLCKSAIAS